MALHPDFQAATWRGTTASDGEIIGISFDLVDGTVIRLKLSTNSAMQAGGSLIEEVAKGDYRALMKFQSAKSSGNPEVEGSMPDDGVKV